jgi:hypothetical protein
MASSSSLVKRSRPGRSRGIDTKRGLEVAAIARASALRSVGEGLVSMKRGLVRASYGHSSAIILIFQACATRGAKGAQPKPMH